MQITFPDFYKEFSCIAGSCPDTCCAGWQIMVDDRSLKKYRRFKGPFRNRLHNDIDWKEHAFRQYDRRCAFLNEENLCDIYSEAGPDMLCDTCRKYPRHIEEFEGLREYSLSLSCPEAARIFLSGKEKTTFHTIERSAPEETYEDFDYLFFTALMDTRDYLLSIVQDRNIPIDLRCQKLLACAHDFQLCLDKNELYKWEDIRRRHQKSGFGEAFLSRIQKWTSASADPVACRIQVWKTVIPKMEVLRAGWPEYLDEILRSLYSICDSKEKLAACQHDFLNTCPDWTIQEEQLLVYWIYTYFCGAVYDGQIFAKIKMAVICTSMIHDLAVGTYLANDHHFTFNDLVTICYRFSRELEHSDLNLNELERLMDEEEIFRFPIFICQSLSHMLK